MGSTTVTFTHDGRRERDLYYKFPMGPLPPHATGFVVELSVAAYLDPGYILQRGPAREMVFVTGIVVVTATAAVDVIRGYNGTVIEDHPADNWMVVATPMPDMRTPEERRLDREWAAAHADCPTCGAPGQRIGERCYYCIHVVPAS